MGLLFWSLGELWLTKLKLNLSCLVKSGSIWHDWGVILDLSRSKWTLAWINACKWLNCIFYACYDLCEQLECILVYDCSWTTICIIWHIASITLSVALLSLYWAWATREMLCVLPTLTMGFKHTLRMTKQRRLSMFQDLLTVSVTLKCPCWARVSLRPRHETLSHWVWPV